MLSFCILLAGPPCEKRKGPCDPNPCRNGGASDCVCGDGSVVPACRRLQNLCSPSPCLNNATCVSRGNEHFCRMDWRVLSICRRCLPDKAKQLFEWSNMHHNKSAILSSTIHLQVPPRLH
ncbi:hypothetical protein KUCAC02_024172, partial [Chaenocephalus aceratus]